jgi:NAD+ synthase
MENEDNKNLLHIDTAGTKDKIIRFIRRYVLELNQDGAMVGLSGGLDSCLVLKLCVEALGSNNVRAVILPERDSAPSHIRDAKRFASALSVRYIVKNLSPLLWWIGAYRLYPPAFLFPKRVQARFVSKTRKKLTKKLGKDIYLANLGNEKDPELSQGKAFYRIKHRLRSNILFYYSELNNLLLVGTSNKSEILTGFFVKYGDNIADIMPLSFLYKTQIKALARSMYIEENIIEKAPSPDLIPGIEDEDMLGLTYKKLDFILAGIEHSFDDLQIMEDSGVTQEEVKRVRKLVSSSEYLRAWPVNLV